MFQTTRRLIGARTQRQTAALTLVRRLDTAFGRACLETGATAIRSVNSLMTAAQTGSEHVKVSVNSTVTAALTGSMSRSVSIVW